LVLSHKFLVPSSLLQFNIQVPMSAVMFCKFWG